MVDTGRDIISGETIFVNEINVKIMTGDYNLERYLIDQDKKIISEISDDDYKVILKSDFCNEPHYFRVYKHSGFIESVDGMTLKEAVETTEKQDN